MSRSFWSCLFALALPVSMLSGCVAVHTPSTLEVEASLSSVSLADDCPAEPTDGTAIVDADCAGFAADCGFCQQTGLQLRFTAAGTGEEVPVEIVSVSLLSEDGAFLEHLTARDPRTFGEEGYVAWDETIAPSEDLHVAYDATSPDWSTVESPEGRYGTRYRVQVVVRIDGVERTLELSPVMREAEIVT
jgi:hypothetical protein